MAEPLIPRPDEPDTAFDEHADAPVREEHGEPADANDTLTSGGRARAGADALSDLPDDPEEPDRT